MKPHSFFLAAFASFCCVAILFAQTTEAPRKINFQGKLNNPTQGPVNLTFAIYRAATGGTALWSETQNNVTVLNGIFNVLLGSVTPIPNAVFKNGGDLFLEIRVGSTPLSKRVQMASVAYAIKATLADTARYAITAGGNGGNRNSLDAADGDPKDAVFVDNDGDVGIGTTNPVAKLHIGGTAGVDGIRFPDGTLQTTAATGTGGGLTLPYSSTSPSNSTLFSLISTGLGPVGTFEIQNPNSNNIALVARTNGLSAALRAVTTGSNSAGAFEIANPSNSFATLFAQTNGTGRAGLFLIDNPSNSLHVLHANTNGLGGAGYFGINNTNNTDAALAATTNGRGPALKGEATGSGYAGDFQGRVYVNGNVGIGTTNPTAKLHIGGTAGVDGIRFPDGTLQTSAALGTFRLPYPGISSDNSTLFSITSTGLGQAGQFEINNGSNSSTALFAKTNGSGEAGGFVINNPNNNSVALYAETNGLNNAGNFEIINTANNTSAVYAASNGIGTAVYGLNTGGGNAAAFEINNGANNSSAFYAATDGLGDAGSFQINNENNDSAAIVATTYGKGDAGFFEIDNVDNTSAAVRAKTTGKGPAIQGIGPINGYAGEFQGRVYINGNLGIATTTPTEKLFVQGNIRATGSITPGSSRESKENIAALSLQEAASALASLNPIKFNYKTNDPKDLHVGFIAEEVPELLTTPDRKGVDPMDVIAVLAKVVQNQQKELAALREEVKALKQQER